MLSLNINRSSATRWIVHFLPQILLQTISHEKCNWFELKILEPSLLVFPRFSRWKLKKFITTQRSLWKLPHNFPERRKKLNTAEWKNCEIWNIKISKDEKLKQQIFWHFLVSPRDYFCFPLLFPVISVFPVCHQDFVIPYNILWIQILTLE